VGSPLSATPIGPWALAQNLNITTPYLVRCPVYQFGLQPRIQSIWTISLYLVGSPICHSGGSPSRSYRVLWKVAWIILINRYVKHYWHKNYKYECRLQSSWTHRITLNWNFMEVWWRFLFWSTSLGKRHTSYNAPPTSQKCAADHWSLLNFLPQGSLFMGQNLNWILCSAWKKWISGTPLKHLPYSPYISYASLILADKALLIKLLYTENKVSCLGTWYYSDCLLCNSFTEIKFFLLFF
jgi:hypothetical protein